MIKSVIFSFENCGPDFLSFFEKVKSSNKETSLFSSLGLGLLELCIRGKSHEAYSLDLSKTLSEKLNEFLARLDDQEELNSFTAVSSLVGLVSTTEKSQVFEWLYENYIKENLYDFPSRLTYVTKLLLEDSIQKPDLNLAIKSNLQLSPNYSLETIQSFVSIFKVCVRVFSNNQSNFKDYFEKNGLLPVIYLQDVSNEFCLLRNKEIYDFDIDDESRSDLMRSPFTIDCKVMKQIVVPSILSPLNPPQKLEFKTPPNAAGGTPLVNINVPKDLKPVFSPNNADFPPIIKLNQSSLLQPDLPSIPQNPQMNKSQLPAFINPQANNKVFNADKPPGPVIFPPNYISQVPLKAPVAENSLPSQNFSPNLPIFAPQVSGSNPVNIVPQTGLSSSGIPSLGKAQEKPVIFKAENTESAKPAVPPSSYLNFLKSEPPQIEEKKIQVGFPQILTPSLPKDSQKKQSITEVNEKNAESLSNIQGEIKICKDVIKTLSCFIVHSNINSPLVKETLEKIKGASQVLSQIEGAKDLIMQNQALNEYFCTQCRVVKDANDFEISCGALNKCQICVNCRASNEEFCQTCFRNYSESEVQYLLILKLSKDLR